MLVDFHSALGTSCRNKLVKVDLLHHQGVLELHSLSIRVTSAPPHCMYTSKQEQIPPTLLHQEARG